MHAVANVVADVCSDDFDGSPDVLVVKMEEWAGAYARVRPMLALL